jgi:hypothetical protein
MKTEKNNAHVVAYKKTKAMQACARANKCIKAGISNSGADVLAELRCEQFVNEKVA